MGKGVVILQSDFPCHTDRYFRSLRLEPYSPEINWTFCPLLLLGIQCSHVTEISASWLFEFFVTLFGWIKE